MINILVTGSRGFLGSTLVKRLLKDSNIRILEFCRGDSDSLLYELIKIADFIFHFAGEVRPKSSDSDFKSSNYDLTDKIVNALINFNKKTPIVFTSTIHAIRPKSSYGETKQASEKSLERYASIQSASIWVYQLPHVFGPGCKPNYNSVISTWIYNTIYNLEVNVFNRDIEMQYCFSLDLADSFIAHLEQNKKVGCVYIQPTKIHIITLGEVIDLINKFKCYEQGILSKTEHDSFEEKLLLTYQSYCV